MLQSLVASGAMGDIWRAHDPDTGERAAIKIMHAGTDPTRFSREMALLASLDDPAIVKHVGHGDTSDGSLYVAMEWLDGWDLSSRLLSGPLGVEDSITLGRRVAGALAVVHARGVIHRDVKPSNIFLPGGRVADAKLLDFGVARAANATTLTGAPIGTPGYMSPEQARGGDIDARADVFSLGCVLYECVTGEPAFSGEHIVAVLARVLMQAVPRVVDLAPDAPPELDVLIQQMLAKSPAERPRDGAACVELLERLVAPRGAPHTITSSAPASVTLSENEAEVASVVLVGAPPEGASAVEIAIEDQRLRTIAETHEARLERLGEGSTLLALSRRGPTEDQATRAARFALGVHRALPSRACALATGRAERGVTGLLLDRVTRLAREPASGVRVDEVTEGLLRARFDVERGVLLGEQAAPSSTPSRAPILGRDTELRVLQAMWDECVSESIARVAIVVGPPGSGKTRLTQELVARVVAKGEPLEIWSGAGDPASAGSSLAMITDMLRKLMSLRPEPIPARREKIRARAKSPETAWFLGELLGTPFDAKEGAPIAAARRDPQLMADQIRRAFEELVLDTVKVKPLIVVLEDLHWGDAATISFFDSALRLAKDKPLLLLATTRPEASAQPWDKRGAQVVRLHELSQKAATALVRALYPEAPDGIVARVVQRGAGNPLFLEELVRAEREGRGDATPETVLAMMRSRLEGLPPALRRVLRAASAFGRTFWSDAIAPLVGGDPLPALVELEARELVVAQLESRFSGEREYAFRHDLSREAAYALLTDEDRAVAHLRAGDWLANKGEKDPLVLAEHFEKGGSSARAIAAHLDAAKAALVADDLDAADALAQRGIAMGASGDTRAQLLHVRAETRYWRGAREETLEMCERALIDTEPGTEVWFELVSIAIYAASGAGQFHKVAELGRAVARYAPKTAAEAVAFCRAANGLLQSGYQDQARAIYEVIPPFDDVSLKSARLQFETGLCMRDGDTGGALERFQDALDVAEEGGNRRTGCLMRANLGYGLSSIGDYAAAIPVLEEAHAQAERMGLPYISLTARQNLGLALARSGRFDEGVRMLEGTVRDLEARGDRRLEGGNRMYTALAYFDHGQHSIAEHEARAALECLNAVPTLRPIVLAILARVLAARGRAGDALRFAREAIDFIDKGGRLEEGEAQVRLAWVETLAAAGLTEEAKVALAVARRRLRERAQLIQDEELRVRFLTAVPEHKKTMEMNL